MGQGQGIGGIAPRPTLPEIKIDGPRGPVVKAPKAEAPQPMDGFATPPSAGTSLFGKAAPGSIPVAQLVPDLSKLNQLAQIRARFASDMVALGNLLHPPELPATTQLERTLAFFMAYAERFVKVAELQPDAGTQNQEDPHTQSGKQGKEPGPLPGGDGPVELPEPGFPAQDPVLVVLGETPPPEAPPPEAGGARPGQVPEPTEPVEHMGPIAFVETPDEPPPMPFRAYTPAQRAEEVASFIGVVEELGFERLEDQRTGRSGTEIAEALLDAPSLAALHAQLDEVKWAHQELPAPDPRETITRDDLPAVQERPSDPGGSNAGRPRDGAMPLQPAQTGSPQGPNNAPTAQAGPLAVQNGQALAWAAAPSSLARSAADEEDERRLRVDGSTPKRLGQRMLWNVLHAFRGRGDEQVTEKDKMDRLTYGAIFILAGLALAIAVVASL